MTAFNVNSVFPKGRTCRWLKQDDSTGIEVRGGYRIMGTCRLFGGEVYDGNCRGCSRYQGW